MEMRSAAAMLAICCLLGASAADSQTPTQDESATGVAVVDETPESEPESEDPAASDPDSEASNPCWIPGGAGEWIDAVQRGTERTVCRAALWFDGLFGDDRAYQEEDGVFGWMLLSARWDGSQNEVDPGMRFRFKAPFPRLERRVSLILGRDHEDDAVRGDQDAFSALPQAFRDAADQEWLLGLGWAPVHSARKNLDFDLGAKLRSGFETYARVRYRRQWFPTDSTLVRLRPALYWRDNEQQTGISLVSDLDHILSPSLLLRWHNTGVHDHGTLGVEWRTAWTLFQSLRPGEAIGYQVAAFGDTGSPVDVERYTLLAIYRHTLGREWLYLDVRPGINWRRADPLLARRGDFELAVGVELRFGKDYRLPTR